MNKYQNGKIYKLIDNTNGNIYIGSTIHTLKRRLQKHLYDYKGILKGWKKTTCACASYNIIKNDDYKIELIINYPCNNNRELCIKEQEYIDIYECINITKAYVDKKKYFKEYRKKNIENIKAHDKMRYIYKKNCGDLWRIDPNLFF
jgi:hypothetical protein